MPIDFGSRYTVAAVWTPRRVPLFFFLLGYCNGQWGESVCGSWGKENHFADGGALPSRKGEGAAVGSRQWGRKDVVKWPLGWETDSPQLQETVMHRVSGLCIVQQLYSIIISELCLTVLLFQENKSYGASYHLHSSSDVREVVLSTVMVFCSSPTTMPECDYRTSTEGFYNSYNKL
jgi:hypothetical protein